MIRSAGFGFDLVALRHPPLLEALGDRRAALAAIVTLRERWDETHFPAAVRRLQTEDAPRPAFKALYRARRDIRRGLAVADDAPGCDGPAGATGWAMAWRIALDTLAGAERRVDAETAAALEAGRLRVRRLLGDDRFAEALRSTNPDAAGRVARALAADPDGSRAATRQDERLLYALAQRLATKNETTSFFGPIDYGIMRPGPATGEDRVALTYAGRPVQRRLVRLSHWAVQALADRIVADPSIAEQVPLRLRGGLWYDGDHLVVAASGRRVPVSPAAAERLVSAGPAASGRLVSADPAAAGLLADLAAGRALRLATLPAEEAATARALLARRVLEIPLTVPAAVDDPAAWLADRLDRLRARTAGVAPWQAGLARLRRAVTDPDEAAADRLFTAATGLPPRRRAGEHYADRTIRTEDCRGGVLSCEVTPAGTDALVRRLEPLLALCGSYSVVIQRAVLRRACELHRRLSGGHPLPYLSFVAELDRAVAMPDILADPEVRAWSDRLDALVTAARDGGTARLSPTALAPLLHDLPDGVVVSPDLFVGADPTAEGVTMATAEIVVGEIHHGAQVWTHLSVLDPDPDGTARDVATVLRADDPAVASVLHRRTQGKAFERELPGTAVEFRTRAALAHPRTLAAESLTVHAGTDGPCLRDPAGGRLVLRARHPRSASNWLFGPPPVVAPTPLGHREAPRVLVGDVVAWRRRWPLDPPALAALTGAGTSTGTDTAALVRAADDLVGGGGLPELVFARAAGARKPVFADLRCPTSLRHLAHYLRGAERADLVEMLPLPHQWWLRPAGTPVSCEWRMTLGWRAAADRQADPHGPRPYRREGDADG